MVIIVTQHYSNQNENTVSVSVGNSPADAKGGLVIIKGSSMVRYVRLHVLIKELAGATISHQSFGAGGLSQAITPSATC